MRRDDFIAEIKERKDLQVVHHERIPRKRSLPSR
jgi:hypothetical protein